MIAGEAFKLFASVRVGKVVLAGTSQFYLKVDDGEEKQHGAQI